MKQLIKMIFAVSIAAASSSVMAGADIKAGEEKATACAACHGAVGVSASPMFPTLAGQHADYMVQTLKAYKSGKRKNPIMQGTAAALSDEDILNLAAYFASQTGLKTLKR
ncbi:MAG TPA: cytochrome c [Cycloclasticus sp.]|jgi:cytochrome c553|nr:cytochrome c [Cycloclasticus sp.]HIL93000.1 cytochrome c [Cycloclasticus sp.]